MLPVVVVCWAWLVKPGAATVMAWALLWPATNPTASSLAAVEVAVPDPALVPVLEVPVATSRGPEVATPANSWTSKLTKAADPLCTVTVVAGSAFAEYHISPLELWPETL